MGWVIDLSWALWLLALCFVDCTKFGSRDAKSDLKMKGLLLLLLFKGYIITFGTLIGSLSLYASLIQGKELFWVYYIYQWRRFRLDALRIKLNTDGSKSSHGSVGGWLLRDRHGKFIVEFSNKYEPQDIFHAELEAMYNGLLLCHQHGVQSKEVQTDSANVQQMICNPSLENWECAYMIRKVRRLMVDFQNIHLIYREQNWAADCLANEAYVHNSRKEYFRCQDLSSHVKKCIFFYRISLPAYRPNCV